MSRKAYHKILLGLFPLLLLAKLSFGHACDDPWRPDPTNAGAPTGGGAGGTIAPPPPPPAPGQVPSGPTGPGSPTSLGAPTDGPGGLANQLPTDALNAGGGDNMSPDNIVLIPETSQLKIVGQKGEFRTYIVNRSPRDLFAVKLDAISSAFDIEVVPKSLGRLVSGEKDYFTVKLKMKGQLKSGKFPMDFKVSSRGTLIYEGSLGQDKKAAKEAAPENLGLRFKTEDIVIGETGNFTVFIKNNIYNEVNQVRIEVNSKYFDFISNPKTVVRLAPGREAEFVVTLTLKKGVKPGAYDIRVHAISSSRNVRTDKMITVKVGKTTAMK